MKVISFCNLKGGSGKSSTAFNIVGILAKKKKKVLVIDCDAQANMTNNFGIDDYDFSIKGVVNLFDSVSIKQSIAPEEIIIKSPVQEMPTVDLMPCNIYLTASEMKVVGLSAREWILRNYFEENADFFKRYDYAIIDTAPSLGIININVFYASDEMILVTDVGVHGYKGCKLIMKEWASIAKSLRTTNNIHGIVINRYSKVIRLGADFLEFVKTDEEFNNLAFKTLIPENIKIRECETVGKPLAFYDIKNVAISAYIDLYKEMVKRGIL